MITKDVTPKRLDSSGGLPPVSPVSVRSSADRLELPPAPIRTALAALERLGLLDVHEHRGYLVPHGAEQTCSRSIYEIRLAVESIALRRAATSESQALRGRQRRCVGSGELTWTSTATSTLSSTQRSGTGQSRRCDKETLGQLGAPRASTCAERALPSADFSTEEFAMHR